MKIKHLFLILAMLCGCMDPTEHGKVTVLPTSEALTGLSAPVGKNIVIGGLSSTNYESQFIAYCTAAIWQSEKFNNTYVSHDEFIIQSPHITIQVNGMYPEFGQHGYLVYYSLTPSPAATTELGWAFVPPNENPAIGARVEFYDDPITKNIGECYLKNLTGTLSQ